MKKIIKLIFSIPSEILTSLLTGYVWLLSLISTRISRLVNDSVINKIDQSKMSVTLNNKELFKIYTPNYICNYRGETFSSKEPETIDWIDKYGGKDFVFYDVGANIGIFSLYYASKYRGKTYSFEPSAFNLRQLAKNININNFHDHITIVPNPISNISGEALFVNGDQTEGGALSAFGVDYGFDGMPINSDVRYGLMGFTLDKMAELGLFSDEPTLMKVDVDGIEHLILEGGKNTLRSKKLKSILIEVNDNFSSQSNQVKRLLESAGFRLQSKLQSDSVRDSISFNKTYNQIWVKWLFDHRIQIDSLSVD